MENKLQAMWDQLTEEQRQQAGWGAVGVIVLVILYMLYSLSDMVTTAEKQLAAEKENLYKMAELVAEIKAAKGSGRGRGTKRRGASLNSSINRSANRYGLRVSRVNVAKNEETAQVYLDAAPFDKMVTWLEDLEQGYNIEIESINITAVRDEPGVVKVNLKIQDMEAS